MQLRISELKSKNRVRGFKEKWMDSRQDANKMSGRIFWKGEKKP